MATKIGFRAPIVASMVWVCPTMDLIAVALGLGRELGVFRFNGQRVLDLRHVLSGAQISSLTWKYDGEYLIIGWTDGAIDVVSTESWKVLQHVKHTTSAWGAHTQSSSKPTTGSSTQEVLSQDSTYASCIGWNLTFFDAPKIKSRILNRTANSSGQQTPPTRPSHDGSSGTTLQADEDEIFSSSFNKPSFNDFLRGHVDLFDLGIKIDLPERLAMLDAESYLPALSVLPLFGVNPGCTSKIAAFASKNPAVNPEIFANQATLDSLMRPNHRRDHNTVETITIHGTDARFTMLLYSFLKIGASELPRIDCHHGFSSYERRVLSHAALPTSNTQVLLVGFRKHQNYQDDATALMNAGTRDPAHTPEHVKDHQSHNSDQSVGTAARGREVTQEQSWCLAVTPLVMTFINNAGIKLQIIASKTAQLQNLRHYVVRCLESISIQWVLALDLPGKFKRNIVDVLAQRGFQSLSVCLYELALTGCTNLGLRNWLVDELGERGHKRWDHALAHGYLRVQELIHENLLPALDRLSILILTLRGLTLQHMDIPILPEIASPEMAAPYSELLDRVQILRLLGHKAMLLTARERRQFSAFSKWLKYQISRLTSLSTVVAGPVPTPPAGPSHPLSSNINVTNTTNNAQHMSSENGPTLPGDAENIGGWIEDDANEPDPEINYPLVLAYLSGAFVKSKLGLFLRKPVEVESQCFDQSDNKKKPFGCYTIEKVKETLQDPKLDSSGSITGSGIKTDTSQVTTPSAQEDDWDQPIDLAVAEYPELSLWVHLRELERGCESLAEQIIKSKIPSPIVKEPITLDSGPNDDCNDESDPMKSRAWDIRMNDDQPKDPSCQGVHTVVVSVPEYDDSRVHIHVLAKGNEAVQTVKVHFKDMIIKDLKFLNDESLVILAESVKGELSLSSFGPGRTSGRKRGESQPNRSVHAILRLEYSQLVKAIWSGSMKAEGEGGRVKSTRAVMIDDDDGDNPWNQYVMMRHVFEDVGEGSRPERLHVNNNRDGQGVIAVVAEGAKSIVIL